MERKYSPDQLRIFVGVNVINLEEEINAWIKSQHGINSGIQVKTTKLDTCFNPKIDELQITIILCYRTYIIIEGENE